MIFLGRTMSFCPSNPCRLRNDLDLSNSYGFYAKYEKQKKIHHFHKKYYSFSFPYSRILMS